MFNNTHQLILKVTRGCNLQCAYCYVFEKEKYDNECMSDETYDYIIRRWMSETNRGEEDNPLDLVFHGGEPLKMGKQKFSRFCKKAYQYAEIFGKRVNLGMQTNGTLLDDDWLELVTRWGVDLGVSWDGIDTRGLRSETSNQILEKLITMKRLGVKGGPLIVLHRGNAKNIVETYKTLKTIGFHGTKANRGVDLNNEKDSDYELTPDELLQVAKDTLDFMIANKGMFFEDSLLQTMRRMVLEKKLLGAVSSSGSHNAPGDIIDHCYNRYCGGMKNLMELDPDGTFQFCGRSSVKNKFSVGGTVFDKDILELSIIRKQWAYQKEKIERVNTYRCNECPAQTICDGGCLAFSFQKYGNAKTDPITCGYFKRLHKYLWENFDKVITFLTDVDDKTIKLLKENNK